MTKHIQGGYVFASVIASYLPRFLVMLGDNVYADNVRAPAPYNVALPHVRVDPSLGHVVIVLCMTDVLSAARPAKRPSCSSE